MLGSVATATAAILPSGGRGGGAEAVQKRKHLYAPYSDQAGADSLSRTRRAKMPAPLSNRQKSVGHQLRLRLHSYRCDRDASREQRRKVAVISLATCPHSSSYLAQPWSLLPGCQVARPYSLPDLWSCLPGPIRSRSRQLRNLRDL